MDRISVMKGTKENILVDQMTGLRQSEYELWSGEVIIVWNIQVNKTFIKRYLGMTKFNSEEDERKKENKIKKM